MGLRALNHNMLIERGLRYPIKCVRLLGELSNLSLNVSAVQDTHFTCAADCRVLEEGYVALSACVWVSLLIGRSLNADANLVLSDDKDRLVVADVAVKSFKFRLTVVNALNIAAEKVFFFRQLTPFLDGPKLKGLVG